MGQLSLVLKTASKPSLIIGQGPVALRKAHSLSRGKVKINLIAISVDEDLESLIENSSGEYLGAVYNKNQLLGHQLIVLIPSLEFNASAIAADAKDLGIPINVYQHPDLSDFYFPYLIDRDPINIAVSSAGNNPAITRIIQHKINALIPEGMGRLALFFKSIQSKVNAKLNNRTLRKRFWHYAVDSASAEALLKGDYVSAEKRLSTLLDQVAQKKSGEVYLIGAGPGDPDLLSFKALRILQSADVVLYDRLINPKILSFIRDDATKLYVGKAKSHHSVPQEQINQWLIDHAEEGKRVVRLKGGDPFIFGRGGEEIAGLQQANIAFEVVPGITAALGCSAYAGIPLTHRDYVQSVRFITGHLQSTKPYLNLDWPSLAKPGQTLVFYMGLTNLPAIVTGLIESGATKALPIALIENGTRPNQLVISGTLDSIVAQIRDKSFSGPVLTIIGEVVKLRSSLNWFNNPDVNQELLENIH